MDAARMTQRERLALTALVVSAIFAIFILGALAGASWTLLYLKGLS